MIAVMMDNERHATRLVYVEEAWEAFALAWWNSHAGIVYNENLWTLLTVGIEAVYPSHRVYSIADVITQEGGHRASAIWAGLIKHEDLAGVPGRPFHMNGKHTDQDVKYHLLPRGIRAALSFAKFMLTEEARQFAQPVPWAMEGT